MGRFLALHVFMGASDGWSGNASWKRKGGFPGTPLHGRNDMKTSKKRFSRQKHAHKQRKKGLSCHHAPPLYNHSSLSEEVWIHECGTLRYGQAPSGAVRSAPKRSASMLVQPSQGPRTPSIVSTVFNSPNGPKDGCSPSIPIPQSPNFS